VFVRTIAACFFIALVAPATGHAAPPTLLAVSASQRHAEAQWQLAPGSEADFGNYTVRLWVNGR